MIPAFLTSCMIHELRSSLIAAIKRRAVDKSPEEAWLGCIGCPPGPPSAQIIYSSSFGLLSVAYCPARRKASLPIDLHFCWFYTKCTKKNGSSKSTGQPAIGLHQSSANHGTLPDKKVHPQVSHIHPSTVLLPKKVRVTKDMRFTQHCIAAASQLLTPQQTSALKEAGMQRIFAALRAPVHVNFQFKGYIAKLLGADPGKLQKMSSNPEAQCPDLAVVEELHNSFKRWEQQPGVCSLMAVCIAAAACKVGTSWPLGHLLLLPNGEEVYACHVGAETPKLIFLVDCKQCQYPLVTVVSATAYNTGLQLGTLPRWGHSCWKIRGGHHDSDFVVEHGHSARWPTLHSRHVGHPCI